MSDPTQELPNPIAETAGAGSTGVEHLERIHQTEGSRSSEGSQALLLLISLGFATGRAYQAAR